MRVGSKRILFVIFSILLIVGAAVFYSYFISPAYKEVLDLRGQVASQNEIYQKFQITFSKVQKLLADLENAPNVQKTVSLILPPYRDVGYFVGQISGLAEANGLEVVSLSTQVLPVQYGQNQVVNPIGRMKADVRLSGSYASFKSFLRQVQSNILLLDVSNIKVESSPGVVGAGGKITPPTLTYNLTIVSYYQVSQ
jgi:Tfp pilus assembly protein PilO